MNSEFKRIFKHSFVYGVGSILTKLIGFLMFPVYTRCLQTPEYGLIEILDNTMNVIGLIVGMGLSVAVLRFFSDDTREEARETLISTAILFTTGLSAAAAVLGIVYSTELSFLIMKTRGYGHPFTVMMFIMFFSTLIELPKVILRARERSKAFIMICIAQLLLACFLNIFFIVFLKLKVIGWLLSALWTSVITCSYLVVTTLADIKKIRFSLPLLKRLLAYSLPLIPASLAMFWIHNGDRFILVRVPDGKSLVGLYGAGYKWAVMITYLIGQPFFLAWSVRMFYVFEQPGGERSYARTFTYFASIVFMAWLFLGVVIEEVIYIMSAPEYHTAYLIVPLVAMGYVLREFSDFFKGTLLIKRRTAFVGIWTLLAAGVSTGLYLLLIPPYQVWGAAWATFGTFAFMAACMFLVSQRVHRVPYEYQRIGVLLCLALALYFLIREIEVGGALLRLCVKGLLSLIFFPILYLSGFFTVEEKEKIRAGIGKVFTKQER